MHHCCLKPLHRKYPLLQLCFLISSLKVKWQKYTYILFVNKYFQISNARNRTCHSVINISSIRMRNSNVSLFISPLHFLLSLLPPSFPPSILSPFLCCSISVTAKLYWRQKIPTFLLVLCYVKGFKLKARRWPISGPLPSSDLPCPAVYSSPLFPPWVF